MTGYIVPVNVTDGTIDGKPTAEWHAWMADHDAHRNEPWWCKECFADDANHVPFDPAVPKHSADGDGDYDTCETCWLSLK